MSSYFTVKVLSEQASDDGSRRIELALRDKYHGSEYATQRRLFMWLSRRVERYLQRRPHKTYDSRINIGRSIIYVSPAVRSWAEYMPGGFAVHHMHNPEHAVLKNGKKIDLFARWMFRHDINSQAVRSRAYAMAWFVAKYHSKRQKVNWFSLAAGTGQPVFDAVKLLKGDVNFTLVDLDREALLFAEEVAKTYGVSAKKLHTERINILKTPKKFAKKLQTVQPTTVDAMGLVEYLSDADAARTLQIIYDNLPAGSTLVFTNMRKSHPHPATYKRGLGWPGIKRRSQEQVKSILRHAGVSLASVSILLPDDGVYAVYGVVK